MNTEILGFAGTVLVAVAYVPQMVHLVSRHCAYGISVRAWLLWLLAALLILPYAWSEKDTIFIVLQLINVFAITFIVIFSHFHRDTVCTRHRIL